MTGRRQSGREQQIRLLTAGTMLALLVMAVLALHLSTPATAEGPTPEPTRRPTMGEYVSHQLAAQQPGPRYEQAVEPWRPSEESPAWAPSSDFMDRFRGMLGALLLMSLVIWGSLKLASRFAPGLLSGSGGGGRKPLLKVLEKQTLAPGMSICLVEVAGKALVVGMTEGSISPLCELTADELETALEAARLPQAQSPPEQSRPDASAAYGNILKHYMSIIPGMGVKKCE